MAGELRCTVNVGRIGLGTPSAQAPVCYSSGLRLQGLRVGTLESDITVAVFTIGMEAHSSARPTVAASLSVNSKHVVCRR